LIAGFFFLGQILLPLVLGSLGLGGAALSSRGRAIFSLVYYLLMAAGSLSVLWWSIRPYRPIPKDMFRLKPSGSGLLWGLGGYFVALPLMFGVALLNQKIWQGQGGSNPLLQTVLEEQDGVALLVFFITAAVAAPLFEEVLFRGFLLPSLTRYLSTSGAIALSAFIFAAAHLSLSEVLPLTLLGAVLGFVYTRSRNLLSPMVLHSAWNSATMLGLFILGG
ncbi:MAG: type II CAAX endopeptidase family protein, partial [Nodosilinea sp.]